MTIIDDNMSTASNVNSEAGDDNNDNGLFHIVVTFLTHLVKGAEKIVFLMKSPQIRRPWFIHKSEIQWQKYQI